MSLTLNPDHALLADVAFAVPQEDIAEVEVCLGANDAFTRGLSGAGVPCVLYPRLREGGVLGCGAHAGLVVELDFDALVDAGADLDALWCALGANKGLYADPDCGGDAACKECILQGTPDARFGDDDPADWIPEDDEEGFRGRLFPLLPADERGPCWSCVTAINEAMAAAVQPEEIEG
jgi:hypothetical protein